MKSSKLLLASLFVMTFVSTALAFKGRPNVAHYLYCTQTDNDCNLQVTGFKEQTSGGFAAAPCGKNALGVPLPHGTSPGELPCPSTARVIDVNDVP